MAKRGRPKKGEVRTSYNGNELLKRTNVNVEWTQDLLDEFAKCAVDPIYFIENYIKIVNVDGGLVPFKMYDFQKEIVEAFEDNRNVVLLIGRQSGKCIKYNEVIKIRNKNTKEITEISIGDFMKLKKN